MTIEEKIEELRKLIIEELKAQEPDTLKRLDWSPSVVDRVLFERNSNASKKFASGFTHRILAKIDFSNVSFKDFDACGYKFDNLHHVFLDTRELYQRDLRHSVFKGVTFTNKNALDYCQLDGADFTGSKNARFNPNTVARDRFNRFIEIKGTKFCDVVFTAPFEYHTTLQRVDFTGSFQAKINARTLDELKDCKLQDATILGSITKLTTISGTDFTGVKGEFLGIPIKFRINPQKADAIFCDNIFKDVVFTGPFNGINLRNTDFTGSEGALIDLRTISFLSKIDTCNFTNAKVIGLDGKEIMDLCDGRLEEKIEKEVDNILRLTK